MRNKVLAASAFIVLFVIAAAGAWGMAEPGARPVDGSSVALVADFHTWTEQDPAYEGGRSGCRRCHLAEYRSWERTKHANALETLPEESRTDPNCVKCHVTGYGQPTGFTSIEETPALAGVGCEVCHGPGSLYKDKEVMESRDASVAAGLLIPDEKTCVACHNAESPSFPGSFDYQAMLAEGVHDIG